MGQTMTLENVLPQENHYINIKELGDVAAIVKNLNDNRNVKCQTKFLTANFTTNGGIITDLQFDNLTVGKNYSLTTQVRVVAGDVNASVFAEFSDGQDVGRTQNQPTSAGPEDRYTQTIHVPMIKASSSTLRHIAQTTYVNMLLEPLFGDSKRSGTWSTLCELPDNYIETDEW